VSKLVASYPQQISTGGFHFIHDSFAGLTWSSFPIAAFRSILSCINPDCGAVMTNVMEQKFLRQEETMIHTQCQVKRLGSKSL